MFTFSGSLESSKSWYNRALIVQSFTDAEIINGVSSADDTVLLKKALKDFKLGKNEFYVGLGGTTFRFLVLRLSRKPGTYKIYCEKELLRRPQSELKNLLRQLNVEIDFYDDHAVMNSYGWTEPKDNIHVAVTDSSQFLSALLLASIDLPFDLKVQRYSDFKSQGYVDLTLSLLKKSGININVTQTSLVIPKNQKVTALSLDAELDISSAFSLIVAGALAGSVRIDNWTMNSLQPDYQCIHFFKTMGIDCTESETSFEIQKQKKIYLALKAKLDQAPDLFPVLAVLCAFAQGRSELLGAPQLKHKESDRILKTKELLGLAGIHCLELNDGLIIDGQPEKTGNDVAFDFDPSHDHRMAMAATVLKLKGFNINILNPEVVNKSYPDFYRHIGIDQ